MKKPSSGKIRSSKGRFALCAVVFGSFMGCLGEPAPLPPEQALSVAAEKISRILAEDQAFAKRAVDRTAASPSPQTDTSPAEIQFWAFTHPLVSRAMARNMATPDASGSSRTTKSPADTFKALYPEIQLHYLHIGEWELAIQKLTVTMAAGELPDVALVKRDWMPRLAEVGLIAPLDNILPESLRADIREPARSLLTFHDLLYALPADGFCSVLYSNRDLVPQPPENWDALRRCLAALAASDARAPARLGCLPYLEMLWSAGGGVCVNGTCGLQSEAARDTMLFFKSLQQENGFALRGMISAQTGLSLLMNRQAAMTVASSDFFPQLAKATVPVQCSPVPGKHGPVARLSDNVIVVFSHHAIEKADALSKLLDYLTGSGVQGRDALLLGSVPVRNSVLAALENIPETRLLDNAFRNGKMPPLVFSWSAIEFELDRYLDRAFRWEPESDPVKK